MAGNSSLADDLRHLFQRIKDEGFDLVPTERGGSLKVVPPGTKLSLLLFGRDGKVTNVCGQDEIGLWYLHELANLLPEARVKSFPDGYSTRVIHKDDSWIRIDEILAIRDKWINLLEQVQDKLNQRETNA